MGASSLLVSPRGCPRQGPLLWIPTRRPLDRVWCGAGELEAVAADVEPGEDAAVEQIEAEGAALEAQDAHRDPNHKPAGFHRGRCAEQLRVPRGQERSGRVSRPRRVGR